MHKEKKKVRIIVIAVVLVVLLLAALLVWLLNDQPADQSAGTTEATHQATLDTNTSDENEEKNVEESNQQAERNDFVINTDGQIWTPYLTLYYPQELIDYLMIVGTEGEPYTLEFYSVLEGKPEQRIFDISLGEGADANVGIAETETGDVPIGMTIYSFEPDDTWTQEEINTVLAMQEALNDMLNALPITQGSGTGDVAIISGTLEQQETVNFLEIETPYCTLKYPAVWEEYLSIEQEEGNVHRVLFYGRLEGKEKQLLFSILLGGDEGEQIGTVTNDSGETVPVNVMLDELDLAGWNDEDVQIIYGMQEAVNQLIDELPLN